MENPYQPPLEESCPEEDDDGQDYREARKGLRFMNALVDQFGVLALFVVLMVPLHFLGLNEEALDGPLGTLLSTLTSLGYYVAFEATLGRTPGKYLTGTVVVHVSGRRPTLAQIVGRTAARLVPFEFLSFLRRSPNGWHDRWSNTRVVLVSSLRKRP